MVGARGDAGRRSGEGIEGLEAVKLNRERELRSGGPGGWRRGRPRLRASSAQCARQAPFQSRRSNFDVHAFGVCLLKLGDLVCSSVVFLQ